MPSRPNRGRRKERHINVFVQEEAPKGRSAIEDDSGLAAVEAEESGENGTSNTAAVATARSRRLRAQRISRQVRARSDIFTRTQGAELRKFAILGTVIVAVMVALTFVLN